MSKVIYNVFNCYLSYMYTQINYRRNKILEYNTESVDYTKFLSDDCTVGSQGYKGCRMQERGAERAVAMVLIVLGELAMAPTNQSRRPFP